MRKIKSLQISHFLATFVLAGACTDANKSITKSDADAGTGGAGAGGAVADQGVTPRRDQGTGGSGGGGHGGTGHGGNGTGGNGTGGNGGGGQAGGAGNDKPDTDGGPGGRGDGGQLGPGGAGGGGEPGTAGAGGVGGEPGTAGATGDGGQGSGGGVGPGGNAGTGGSGGVGPGGNAGTGGSVGPGGNAGTGGSLGSVRDAGTGGSVGPGGSVGKGGSGGTGGSVGPGGNADPGGNGGSGGNGDPGGNGGMGEGGIEPPPPPPPACDSPPCEWPVTGDWGPAARMTYFNVPADAATARRLGCDLLGARNGTALANARGLPIVGEGDLSVFFMPDGNGVIPAILLARLAGADAGELFGATGPIDFQFFQGVSAAAGAFQINPNSFVPGTQDPRVHFANTDIAADGGLSVPSSDFSMMIPVFGGVALGVSLEDAIIRGWISLSANGLGFDLPLGTIEGYLTRDAVVRDWIQPLQALCSGGAPLAVCAAVGPVIGPPGSCNANFCLGADLVAATLGSWEVHVDDAGPRVCNGRIPGDCNAVGVCFETRMEGVSILGVAP